MTSVLSEKRAQKFHTASDWLNQISHAARPIRSTTQIWVRRVISVEFLHSFLRRHLAEKPVVASPKVGCFLRLKLYRRMLSTYQETSWTLKNMSFISYCESTSVAGFTLPLGRLSSELPESFPFSLCCRLY